MQSRPKHFELPDTRRNPFSNQSPENTPRRSCGIQALGRSLVSTAIVACVATLAGAQAQAQTTVHFPLLPAGSTATLPQVITVTATTSGTISAVQVLTKGSPSSDFIDAGSDTCIVNQTLLVGQTCAVNVVLQPKYPGFHAGAVVLKQSSGDSLGVTYIDGSSDGSLALISPGLITTVAGDGSFLHPSDGVPAVSASIFLPMGIAIDGAGNLFFSDSQNSRIRRVDAATGLISTVVGNGNQGFSGDGGLATSATISAPSAVVLDGAGNLYFADSANHVIRKVAAGTGIITSIAGIGTRSGYTGDLGPGSAALLFQPSGLALDSAQNLYIADTYNNVIRKLSLSTGIITTVAGTGVAGYTGDGGLATTAQFSTPWGLSITSDGSLYIADLDNNVIRKIAISGVISTVVGTGVRGVSGDGGLGSAATLNSPAGVTVDVAGNIYIADSGNNRVRKVNAKSGAIETVVGAVGETIIGDGGNANNAGLYGPYALLLDGPGNLYIADMLHNRVRMISSNAASLIYQTLRVDRTSPQQPEALENDGNADLTLASLTLNNASLDPTTTTCFASEVLKTGISCALGVQFAPTTIGSPISGSVTLNTDAAKSPGVISLSGTVLNVDPTTVTLASSVNPAGFGTPFTLTSKVSTTGTAVTGTIKFMDGTTLLGTITLGSVPTATFAVTTMALGSHSLTAVYSGDASNAASTSTALVEVIKQPTTLVLTSSLNPSVVSANVTFTATLTGFTAPLGGNVTLFDGAKQLGTLPLTSGGVATYSIATLTPGPHNIVANFTGDTANMISTASLTQTVNQAGTVTTIATSNGSITVGDSVTFTSNVSSNGGPTPTGNVTFKDGTVILGTGILNGSGIATLTNTTLAPGAHSITAVYQGDVSNTLSTSSSLTETVAQIATGTSMTSSANPSNAGAALTLTATVAAAGGSTAGGALTGSVTFHDGAAIIGTGTLSGSGVATISVKALTVGAHTLTAVFSGNVNYAISTSVGFAQQIQNSSTTTTLVSNSNPSIAGKNVVLTATVVTVGGAATGTVTFIDGGVTIGQGTLAANGVGSMSTSTLAVGTHNIVATYNGDANNLTSSSTPLSQGVQIATTNLVLTASPNPTIAGVTVLATATLTWNGGQPTGTITFQDGGTVVGSAPIRGTAPVSISLPSLSVGTHLLTASYVGDANDSPTTSNAVSEVINQAGTTTDIATSQSPIAFGQSVTFSSNVKSASSLIATGTVTFHDGASILGVATLNATGSATLQAPSLTLGSHSVTAVYSGDANHSASSSTTITQQVLQATVASLTSSANPAIAGKVVTFTTRLTGINGVVPTGTITFKDGGSVLGVITVDASGAASFSTSTLTLGAHPITATYSGDTNFNAVSSAVLTQTIKIADTNIAFTSSANPAVFGTAVAFTASITGTGGAVTGTVTIQDGTAVLGKATLDGSGVAVFSTSTLSPGMHSISALYSGDSNNSPNVSAVLQQQVQQTTRTTVSSSANPSLTLTSVTITAAVANGGSQPATGTVKFTEGASVLGSVTLDVNGLATLTLPSLVAGSHPIVATYSGDIADLPSVSVTLAQVVQLRPTTTALTATSTSLSNGQQVTLISVVAWTGPIPPTGTVAFKNGNVVIGTSPVDKAGVATLTVILDVSQVNLVASYSGDTVYSPSNSGTTPVTAGPATQFTLALSSLAVTLQSKQHATVDLTMTSIKGFADTMTLGCLGLPYAATCTFSADQPKLTADGVQTVHLVIDTGNPLGAGATAKNHSTVSSSTMLAFMPLGALIGILVFRSRRRVSLGGLLLVLCFLGLSLGLSGCGTSLNVNGTPAGTYSFKVTAAGLNTGVSQSKDVTLTVTQ